MHLELKTMLQLVELGFSVLKLLCQVSRICSWRVETAERRRTLQGYSETNRRVQLISRQGDVGGRVGISGWGRLQSGGRRKVKEEKQRRRHELVSWCRNSIVGATA